MTIKKKAISSAEPIRKKSAATKKKISTLSEQFVERLESYRTPSTGKKTNLKSNKDAYDQNDVFMGVRMGQIFALAKEFIEMPPREIAKLLTNKVHEVRVGAVSIMDFQARKKQTPERMKELFDLYIKHHNRINHWGMVDRAAPHVVGGYLFDKPRNILYKLARSKDIWERRTAIVSTYYFIRQGDVADTFKIAEMLVNDKHHFIHTAVGGWVREAGKKDRQKLISFLNKHAATMPRTALRYAIEHLDKKERDLYLSMKA